MVEGEAGGANLGLRMLLNRQQQRRAAREHNFETQGEQVARLLVALAARQNLDPSAKWSAQSEVR